jgi:hypothetical protein
MHLDKYVRLLQDRCLYLARIDAFLKSDAAEGRLPELAEARLRAGSKQFPSYLTESIDRKLWSRQFYVSCWYMSPHESAGMWERYGGGKAVCIVSSYDRLAGINGDGQVHIGPISYIDYRSEDFRWWDEFAPVMHKRVEYHEEREVRILLGRVCSFLLSNRKQVVANLKKQPAAHVGTCPPPGSP